MNSKKTFYSAAELAQITGITRNTIYILARDRKIPHLRIGGRVWFPTNILETLTIDTLTK